MGKLCIGGRLRSFVGIRALAANLRCRWLTVRRAVALGDVGALGDFHLHAGRNVPTCPPTRFWWSTIECLFLRVPTKPTNATPDFDLCAGGRRKCPRAEHSTTFRACANCPDCTYLLRSTHAPPISALFVTLRLSRVTGSAKPGTGKDRHSEPSAPEKTKTWPWDGSTMARSATPSLLRSPTTASPATRPISGRESSRVLLHEHLHFPGFPASFRPLREE